MNLAELSIRRPIFVTCLVLVMLVAGYSSMRNIGVDLFPDVTFPVVTVTTPYPGAGPQEIETLVSKPVEEEISTIAGIKRLTSVSLEGASIVVAEFRLETDIKYAEQQVRDRVSSARPKLPRDVKEAVIRRIDPADQPVLTLSLRADLPEGKLFDVADDILRPRLEQIADVGQVTIRGGRKREIHVQLNRGKLRTREISASQVAMQLGASGENVPSGKVDEGSKETVFRTIGDFRSLDDIKGTLVSLYGNEVATSVDDVGAVVDTLADEKSRVFVNGNKSLFLDVYRQSGSNTIAVTDRVKKSLVGIGAQLATEPGKPVLEIVRDGAKAIRDNVDDVQETILLGILLTIMVVYFFLGNGRSTLITGLALPNSLLGGFVLMAMFGFTINIVTLLALSLSVGLLIDDAIVVRENIFRHVEMGKNPVQAALQGTAEVRLAVIATTMTVIAVFGPVAFMKGVIGQFFRQFGLTVCFTMAISLFDAMTIAPMLSAYFAGGHEEGGKKSFLSRTWGAFIRPFLAAFEAANRAVERFYLSALQFTLRRPLVIMGGSVVIFVLSFLALGKVPKTFIPPPDSGEFLVNLDLPPGTNLDEMGRAAKKADELIRSNKEVEVAALTVGGRNGEANEAEFYIKLLPSKQRPGMTTTKMKDIVRDQLQKGVAEANPKVKDYTPVQGGETRPFVLRLIGQDQKELEKYGAVVYEKLSKHPGLSDVDTSYRPGKPEFQVALRPEKAGLFGIHTKTFGGELRAQVEGLTPAKYRENGREYDVRVRMEPAQRNVRGDFNEIMVPNLNGRLVRLADIATAKDERGPANINRQDRGRYIQIAAAVRPGAGLGDVMGDVAKMFANDVKLPPGIRYTYVGDSENFQEFAISMGVAIGASILFIFLVLASLYESFVTPLTIMLALPLAMCGAFFGLYFANESVNLFSMIGVIMLLGVASKNSILLVDYARQRIDEGIDRKTALLEAGKTRLRPILMTTMALIAGTLPVALGLNEASKQRTSMGVAIIGGLISSTILTLVVVPAAFTYIERFRLWSKALVTRIVHGDDNKPSGGKGGGKNDAKPAPETRRDRTAEARF